jgi:hypothetical protein
MLRHKAIIQAARVAFGYSLKDPDEAERIIEAQEVRAPINMPRAVKVVEELPPATDSATTTDNPDADELPFKDAAK